MQKSRNNIVAFTLQISVGDMYSSKSDFVNPNIIKVFVKLVTCAILEHELT